MAASAVGEPCDAIPMNLQARRGESPAGANGGVDTLRETPVPIPNTEVKTQRPMILHCGKVGERRLIRKALG